MTAKILAIEDEAGIRALLKQALEPPYEVHVAADGTEGLEQAQTVKPNLILLDLRMPGMDGLAVLAKLKSNPKTNTIPVVIASVAGEADMLLECQRAGAADHLIKPFQIEDLRKTVQRQLSLQGD